MPRGFALSPCDRSTSWTASASTHSTDGRRCGASRSASSTVSWSTVCQIVLTPHRRLGIFGNRISGPVLSGSRGLPEVEALLPEPLRRDLAVALLDLDA